jgi:hypothetical protein
VHRASPTLLVLATCLAASLLTAAPVAADDTVPAPFASPSPFATPSPFTTASPFTIATPDTAVVVPAVREAPARPSLRLPRATLPLRKGHYGSKVARLQQRLSWLGYDIHASNTGRQAFGRSTKDAVRAFQAKNWLTPSGKVTKKTWRQLRKQAEPLGILPLRCTEVKRALCIDKTTRTLRLVVKGEVRMVADARFGAPGMETDEGVFAVKEKSYNHTSSKYGSWMPRAMFFNGHEAVHYSPDFASIGYSGGSHGCVGLRDLDLATRLFEKVDIGTRVYVYWS